MSKAELLAVHLEDFALNKMDRDAAAELRRLSAINAELIEALKRLKSSHKDYTESQERGWPSHTKGYPNLAWAKEIENAARAAIAKAQGEQL